MSSTNDSVQPSVDVEPASRQPPSTSDREQSELRKLKLEIRSLEASQSWRGWFSSWFKPSALTPILFGAVTLGVAWYTGLIDVKRIALEKATLENQRVNLETSIAAAEQRSRELQRAEQWYGLLDQAHAHILNVDEAHGYQLTLAGPRNTFAPSPGLSIQQVKLLMKPPGDLFAKQLEQVTSLTIENIQPDEAALAELLSLPSLTSCDIYTLRFSGQPAPKIGTTFATAVYKSRLIELGIGSYAIDPSILHVLLTAPSLKSLSLQNISDLNDGSFTSFPSSSPITLKRLFLGNCQVSASFVRWLPVCPEMEDLTITTTGKSTAVADLRELNGTRFPRLAHLDLRSVRITDWSWLDSLKALDNLWLSDVVGTAAMVDHIPNAMKNILFVDCDATPELIETIHARRPKIKDILRETKTEISR